MANERTLSGLEVAKAPRSSPTRISLPFMLRIKSRVVILGLLFFALTRVAFAQTIWNTQSGDWFQTANWSDGVPDSATDTQVNNGGTPQVAAAGASTNNLYLGFDAGDSGNLLVSGSGTLQAANLLAVGYTGTGTMTAINGATVSDLDGGVGGVPESNGTVLIDGVGSTWTNSVSLGVGGFGNGTLTISNGGTVISGMSSIAGNIPIFGGGSGSVTVDGSDDFGQQPKARSRWRLPDRAKWRSRGERERVCERRRSIGRPGFDLDHRADLRCFERLRESDNSERSPALE
jgi:T5SS/PEP-CTERM-associated repeat protein